MSKNPLKDINSYELIENDAGELMILLYANQTPPAQTSFFINEEDASLELNRNANDTIILDGLAPVSIEKLKSLTSIYVCELKYKAPQTEETNEEEDDFDIEYAYTAPLKKKEQKEPQQETLQEKLLKAKKNLLKKQNEAQTLTPNQSDK